MALVQTCKLCGRTREIPAVVAALAQLYAAMPFVCEECLEKFDGERKEERRAKIRERREAAGRN